MVVPFITSLADSPIVTLPAGPTVDIAPGDVVTNPDAPPEETIGIIGSGWGTNAVDTNRVIVNGSGTINSFGLANGGQRDEFGNVVVITKRVEFQPDAGQTITLHHNPPTLVLLGNADHAITTKSFGEYQSDTSGNWTEIGLAAQNISPTKQQGGLISVNYYTASGAITIPPPRTRAFIRMWAAPVRRASGKVMVRAGFIARRNRSAGYVENF